MAGTNLTNFSNGISSFGIPVIGGGVGVFSIPPSKKGIRRVGANQKYGTIASAVADCQSGDTILLVGPGDFTESGISTPSGVTNVAIIGMGNVQRSTRWKNSNAAEPFITVNASGWTFWNIYFAGGTAGPCIKLLRDASNNASESRIMSCIFNGGSCHIENTGACSNVRIEGNRFINARGGTATTPGAIVCNGTAQAVATNVQIINNEFYNCQNLIAHSMSRSMVYGNKFQATGHDGAATQVCNLVFNSAQGDYNMVMHNVLGVAGAVVYDNDATLKFQDGGNSVWADNYANDAVDYGLPG